MKLQFLKILKQCFLEIQTFNIEKKHGEVYNKKNKAEKKNFENFVAPFYRWGSTASRLQPLRGGSLLFTIQFPEIPDENKLILTFKRLF